MGIDSHGALTGARTDPREDDAQGPLVVNAQMVRCVLPEFDQVSITVIDSTGGVSTCARAGDLVADLDRLQYDLREGPGIDSLRAAAPVLAPHIQRDERWRRYVPSAAALGLRSQLAAPLRGRGDKPMGALNMYSTTRDEIAPTALLIAQTLTAQVASALTSSREIQNLHDALATRSAIGAAIGLLMAKYNLTEAAAFDLLRRRSSHANLKIRDVAARVVAEHNTSGRELPPRAIC